MFTSATAKDMNQKKTDKLQAVKKKLHKHCQKMRDYQDDCDTIDSMELSHLVHSIPANDNETNTSMVQAKHIPIESIYQCDISQMSKRTKHIINNTINKMDTTCEEPKNEMYALTNEVEKFMKTTNRPYSIKSAMNKFGFNSLNNNTSEKQFESILEHLISTNKLSKKEFSNGQILYWAQQHQLENDEIEMNDIIANKEYELKQKKLKLKMLQQQRYALQNDET
eukprot:524219_1